MKITSFVDCEESKEDKQGTLTQVLYEWQNLLKLLEKNICSCLTSPAPVLASLCQQTEVQIIVIDAAQMLELNTRFRNATYATDVLTFNNQSQEEDFQEDIRSSDIFICLATAQAQASEYNITLQYELTLLSIHGILHALGLDHERGKEELELTRLLEQTLLQSLAINKDIALSHRDYKEAT